MPRSKLAGSIVCRDDRYLVCSHLINNNHEEEGINIESQFNLFDMRSGTSS
jgi:hypothetical protein